MNLVFSSSPTSVSLTRTSHPRMLVPGQLLQAYHTTRGKQAIVSNSSSSKVIDPTPAAQRRLAQYHPTIWGPDLIDSFTTHYTYESHGTRLEGLKKNVAKAIVASSIKDDACSILKLIASVQRLGVAYHFRKEIQEALATLLSSNTLSTTNDLHTAALQFQILRENGISVSSDLFNKFRSGEGSFKDSLSNDVEGLLSLYEASHLGMPGEDVLEEAKRFSSKILKQSVATVLNDDNLTKRVKKSLQTPVHWRMPRIEALNFIDMYQRDDSKNLALLELAKLDYNLVQSVYQIEIKELSRWWRKLDFKSKASFSRDRLMESYLGAMGISHEPQFSECRIGLTKFMCILTVIDDMYDVYGFLDELECFTDAVIQWNMEAKEKLPEYMKPIYIALLEFGNELSDNAFKNSGLNPLPCIKNEWVNLCKTYIVEARWFYGGYTPTLEEYLKNAWTSVGGPAVMLHAYLLTEGCQLTEASLESFNHGFQLIYWSSIVTRLNDDLGTSKPEGERGDVVKSIQCYMEEKGVSEEEAQDYIKGLISYSWKKINQESAKTSIPKSIVNLCLNMARTAHCIYEHGDGIGNSIGVTKDRLISLITNPIPG
ncbi:probable terpene synthase 9 [Rosa rugosa]|uniref:probable terpene synthase 9 n=1 Tax=Rosa rugosa TaxID=74645 RepID=UPI002B40AA80|nr:probable terpene synthase 9 [Rosa rugosa]